MARRQCAMWVLEFPSACGPEARALERDYDFHRLPHLRLVRNTMNAQEIEMARLDGLSCTQYPFILNSILTPSRLGALPSLGAARRSARIRRSPTPANNPLQHTVTWAPILRKDSLELARERLESAVSSTHNSYSQSYLHSFRSRR